MSQVVPRLLKPEETADLLGVATVTLERWRWSGDGPPFVKLSRRAVRYREDDLRKWIEGIRRRSTSDPGSNVA